MRQALAGPRPAAATLWTATATALHTIDVVTGVAARVGAVSDFGLDAAIQPTSLAWDGRILWMASSAPGRLYRLDRATGVAERVDGPDDYGVGEGSPTALAWDGGDC